MKKIDFGFEAKKKKDSIFLSFKQPIANWKRYASQLIEDRVILDLENAKKLIEAKGDFIVYELYNLWKSVEEFKKIYERTGIVSDVTLLNHGIFSLSERGELFTTYGHAHEAEVGEAHLILKNECFLILSDRKTGETFILRLKEGDFVYIPPRFLHRSTSFTKDCLLITFAPEKAGHDYLAVKGRGFPFHLFYDKKRKKLEIKKNKKYEKAKYELVKRVKRKVNPLNALTKNPEGLKEILENPGKHKKIYFGLA